MYDPHLLPENEILALAKPYKERRIVGVYFLIDNGRIVYVGQSTNVDMRLSSHRLSLRFDSVTIIECPTDDLNRIEAHYIHYFRPPFNKYIPSSAVYLYSIGAPRRQPRANQPRIAPAQPKRPRQPRRQAAPPRPSWELLRVCHYCEGMFPRPGSVDNFCCDSCRESAAAA